MKAVAHQSYTTKSIHSDQTLTLAEKFSNYCDGLEEYRILLLSAFLLVQGCIIVPFTILIISFIDLGLGGLSISLLAIGTIGVLITNMAETPIKAIIIAFSLSLASSLAIIAIHLLSL